MERNKSGSICSTPWSSTERVYSTPGVDLERNKCYSGVDPRLVQSDYHISNFPTCLPYSLQMESVLTYHWSKIQPLEVMTMETRGISVIVVTQACICHWIQVPNRQGNYPFTYLMSLIIYEVNLLKGLLPWRLGASSQWQMDACVTTITAMPLFSTVMTSNG